jgi:hypothetical protein
MRENIDRFAEINTVRFRIAARVLRTLNANFKQPVALLPTILLVMRA